MWRGRWSMGGGGGQWAGEVVNGRGRWSMGGGGGQWAGDGVTGVGVNGDTIGLMIQG
jgi:hypothetical protein